MNNCAFSSLISNKGKGKKPLSQINMYILDDIPKIQDKRERKREKERKKRKKRKEIKEKKRKKERERKKRKRETQHRSQMLSPSILFSFF